MPKNAEVLLRLSDLRKFFAYGIRNSALGIRNPRFTEGNPEFSTLNPESTRGNLEFKFS